MYRLFVLLITLFLSFLHAKEPLTKVSLQLMWLDQFEFAGFYVAKEKGYYKELGLDVSFIKYEKDINIVQNVIDKKADFGTGSSSLLVDKSKGKDIVLLGSIFQSSPLMLMGLKNTNITHLKDIKGKKIMLAKDQQRFATLQAMLSSQNVSLEDIEMLEHSFSVDDLINKTTDFMIAYTTNEPYLLKEKGYETQIFHPKDYGFDFYENIIFTTSEFSNKNPKVTADFYKASIKGWQYAYKNIAEVAHMIHKKYNPQEKSLDSLIFEAIEMRKLSYTKNGTLGEMTKEKVKLIENSYRIMGLINEPLNLDNLLFNHKSSNNLALSQEEQAYLKEKKQLNLCIDPNWMPFEKNENGNHIGVTAEYFKILESKLDIPIKMVPASSWTQSLQFGKDRKCDLFSLVMPTPKRRDFLDFTQPYLNIPLVIASDLHTTYIDSIEQVQHEKLGIVQGYAYGEILKTKYPNINFIYVKDINQGLEAVKEKEIFGFIGSLATVGFHIQQNYIGQLKITGKFKDTWNLGIATRNDEPMLKTIFDKAMKTIPYDTRQSILNKWVSVNYSKNINMDMILKVLGTILVVLIILVLIYRQYLLNDLNKRLNKKVKEEIDKNSAQEKILSQQAKMAAMGEMIGNIAHQWRQPLTTISIAATGMKFQKEMDVLTDEEFENSIDSITNSTQFLSDTIDNFRNFFKSHQILDKVYLCEIFSNAYDLFGLKFGNKDITIIENIEDKKVETYKNELIQVLINLLNNAKDAFEKQEKKLIFISAHTLDNHLIITLRDNAGGIDEAIITRVFEPYFTTKHKSQGTGIGLYMSEQIITKHMQGCISVANVSYAHENQEYKGAEFKIEIAI